MKNEIILKGITIVPGKGAGKAYFAGRVIEQTSHVSISRQDVGDQIMRFNEIREKAKADYREAYSKLEDSPTIDSSILTVYEHILDDPAFIGQVVETITSKLFDLETAVRLVSNDFIKKFNAAGTAYFKERSSDMVEVCEKLISFLHQDNGRPITFLDPVVMVVSRMFTPSDILAYDKTMIQAVVSSSAGSTSHAAILARAYSIPVVSGITDISGNIRPGDLLFVDADKAEVHVRPNPTAVTKYIHKRSPTKEFNELKQKWQRPVYTKDGIQIEVLANVSLSEDVDDAKEHGADGIGLVRTEYLLSNRKSFPPEEVHEEYYEAIFKKVGSKHCVVRIMDIGGDKIPQYFNMPQQFNPFMGWRGIRILLERKELFETQVSAIIKAGRKSSYSIMLPLITTLSEFLASKELIQNVAQKLHAKTPACGVLFEVPLAILEMETFMKEIDFAAIGTNDLIQYLSAADRNNSKVNFLYNPIEPAFLKILKNAIKISRDNGKPLSICGEMAGDPFHTVMLVGMGLKRFSIIPRNIPLIKELISNISYAEAAECVSHLEAIESTEAVSRWIKSLNKRMLGKVVERLPGHIDIF